MKPRAPAPAGGVNVALYSTNRTVAPNVLLAGASCTITVVFRPSALGPRSGTVSGVNAGDFAVVADGCSGVSLLRGTSCTLKVGFEPLRTGGRSATLTIAHDGVSGPSLVALSGYGVAPVGGDIP